MRTYGRSGPELRALLSFGRETTIARVLNAMAEQVDRVLVGTLAGAAQLGFYQNARRWSELPALQLVLPIKSVAVASFSQLQREPERYRAAARSVFAAAFAALLPLMAFLCVEAEEVILMLFGPKWLPAVPFFRLLAVAVFFGCANRLTVWVYLSEGASRRRLQWTLISRPLTIGAVVAGAVWGPLGIVVATAVVTALLAYPSVRFCLRTSPLRETDVWGAAWRPAVAGGGAAALLAALPATSDTALALRLLRDGAIFGSACVAIWLALPGGLASARDLLQLLRSAGPIRGVDGARHELLGPEVGGRRP
jgi:PST family polysaccharide transporter